MREAFSPALQEHKMMVWVLAQSGELRLLLAMEGHLEMLPPALLRGGWKQVSLSLKRIKLWVTRIADVFLLKQGAVLPILSSAQDIWSQQFVGSVSVSEKHGENSARSSIWSDTHNSTHK